MLRPIRPSTCDSGGRSPGAGAQSLAARPSAVCRRGARGEHRPDVPPLGGEASLDEDDRQSGSAEVLRELDRAGIAPQDISLRRPTLDEVFLRLTESDDSTTAKTEVMA